MSAVTEQEFQEWLAHPITVQLKKQIRKDVTDMQEMLMHIGEEDLKELQGRCKASINLLNVEYGDLYE
jgi:DNA-binding transcriptional regulator GbsR (MarR family)